MDAGALRVFITVRLAEPTGNGVCVCVKCECMCESGDANHGGALQGLQPLAGHHSLRATLTLFPLPQWKEQ